MDHKFAVGTAVYYTGGIQSGAVRGLYKIIRQLPIERDNKLLYRIKSATETFERTAEEMQLSRDS